MDDVVRGDWMHPGEPADRGPAVVEVDSEFPFRLHPGRCLAETLVAAEAEYADDKTTHATIAAVMTPPESPASQLMPPRYSR
ncbi:hypothetical protein ACFQ3B_23985 [Stackebrandtia endophytica]|uniref:hypothetical protein n=1 Tax=Stackebrandtia endophytica TaxID=1496996 RepID=UPI00114E8772|nr:hypothetical protein [Stackebrandtia endophytica]